MKKDNDVMLIDDYPVLILPKLAEEIGLNKAIVLQQIHFWLSTFAKKNDGNHFVDDCWWVWNTYDEWQTNFPWWSSRTIQRIILELEKDGYLISKQLNKSDWDKTKYYTIDYAKLGYTDSANLSPSTTTTGHHLNKNTEITTKTTTKIKPTPRKRDARIDHPALVTYKEIIRYHVPIIWRDRVIEAVTNDPDMVLSWTKLLDDWIGRGWKPTNIKGQLEAYNNGGISRQPTSTAAKNAAMLEEVFGG